jgi:hypothetical protein
LKKRQNETDGKGADAIVYLHYFTSGCDWWIREKDMEAEQLQAFGWASLNGDYPELGYISIVELLSVGAELDLHFEPRTWEQLQKKDEPPVESPQGRFMDVEFAAPEPAVPVYLPPWRRI